MSYRNILPINAVCVIRGIDIQKKDSTGNNIQGNNTICFYIKEMFFSVRLQKNQWALQQLRKMQWRTNRSAEWDKLIKSTYNFLQLYKFKFLFNSIFYQKGWHIEKCMIFTRKIYSDNMNWFHALRISFWWHVLIPTLLFCETLFSGIYC